MSTHVNAIQLDPSDPSAVAAAVMQISETTGQDPLSVIALLVKAGSNLEPNVIASAACAMAKAHPKVLIFCELLRSKEDALPESERCKCGKCKLAWLVSEVVGRGADLAAAAKAGLQAFGIRHDTTTDNEEAFGA